MNSLNSSIFKISLLLIVSQSLLGRAWEKSFHMALLCSDNVFESIDAKQNDEALRLQFRCRSPIYKISPHFNFNSKYQCGFEGYQQHTIENRWVHILGLNGMWQPARYLIYGISIRHKLRHFFQSGINYQVNQCSPSVLVIPNHWLIFGFDFKMNQLNYQQDRNLDFQSKGYKVHIKSQLNQSFSLSLFYEKMVFDYDRFAFIENDSLFFKQGINHQKDHIKHMGFFIELYANMLIQLGYTYELNQSNSIGFDYSKPQIHLLMAKNILDDWTINFFFKLSWKKYKDNFAPYWPLIPNTEIEENNHIWLSITKDLSSKLTLKNQIGWYRNESPFRNRYYAKHSILLGLVYQL